MNQQKSGYVEQRQFERVQTSVKVSYRMLAKEELTTLMDHSAYNESKAEHLPGLAEKSLVFHAVTRDMSLGGMSILCDDNVPVGTPVSISLTIPNAPVPVTMMAEVVRIEQVSSLKSPFYRAGIKVLAINREDVVRIEKYILIEKLKQHSDLKHKR